MGYCPYCGIKGYRGSGKPPATKADVPVKIKKSRKALLTAIIIAAVLIAGFITFIVLDVNGIIPTGVFGGKENSGNYIDDDGDERPYENDEKIFLLNQITLTAEAMTVDN